MCLEPHAREELITGYHSMADKSITSYSLVSSFRILKHSSSIDWMRRFRKSHKIKGGRVNHPEHLSVNCNHVFISRISSTALTGKLGSFVGWKEGGKIYCSLRRANYERAEEKRENGKEFLCSNAVGGSQQSLHTWRNRWLNTRAQEKRVAAVLSSYCC